MTENEKLRELLKSAKDMIMCCRGLTNLHDEIEAALKESKSEKDVELAEVVADRNRAWQEIGRLRNALAQISLSENESMSSASEKVRNHAHIARKALHGDKEWNKNS